MAVDKEDFYEKETMMDENRDIHCHHIIHRSKGGSDRYENLMLVTENVHRLLHATNAETIQILLTMLNLTTKQKAKINYYREKAGLMGI